MFTTQSKRSKLFQNLVMVSRLMVYFVQVNHLYSASLCLTNTPPPPPVSVLQTWREQPTVLLLSQLQTCRSPWSLWCSQRLLVVWLRRNLNPQPQLPTSASRAPSLLLPWQPQPLLPLVGSLLTHHLNMGWWDLKITSRYYNKCIEIELE